MGGKMDCSKCKNLIRHDIDDIECWCEKGMFEKYPYKPILKCEYYEEVNLWVKNISE